MKKFPGYFAVAVLLEPLFATAQTNSPVAQPPHSTVYHASLDNVKYAYGPAPAVVHLSSGDYLETNTLDAFGGGLQKPGDTLSGMKGRDPLTGPFYIEGAEAGDTLDVEIVSIEAAGDQGVGVAAPGLGALSPSVYTPLLDAALPERIWFYPINRARGTATFTAHDSKYSVKIPLHFFLGCVGVAPAGGEVRGSVVSAEFGGKMDAPEASVGVTIHFPVNAPGALLYMGCGQAASGDGEIAGTGIEVPLSVTLRVKVIKGKSIKWPRFEDEHHLVTVGSYRPVDDASRIAFHEMIQWIHDDYHLSEMDAYELLSKVARVRLTEMVNPNYVVVVHVSKKYLNGGKD
jgi:acetamidase/formamidase